MSLRILCAILFTVTLSACAQLVLKLGMEKPGMKQAIQSGPYDAFFGAITSLHIWSGLIMYGAGMVLWLWILSKVNLSVAYPFVGLSFILTMAFGFFLLNEQITLTQAVGTVLIAIGCALVGHSA